MSSGVKMKLAGVAVVLMLFLGFALWGQILESVDADEIMVVQSPTGELSWYTSPGIKLQMFGKVTKYKKMSDIQFKAPLMFNDKGTGYLMGKFQLALPLDVERLTAILQKYPSQEAVENSLVIPTIEKVIYMTGPLMSSQESAAERKTDLIRYIVDQVEHGVYRTRQKVTVVEDVLKQGEKKEAVVADLAINKEGQVERQEESALTEFGIKIVNFAPSNLDYDPVVVAQFRKQQEIVQQVQTSMAQATEAAQQRITAKAQGEARVMTAQYEKEVEKIQAVTEAQKEREVGTLQAQKELEVATLAARAAEQYKRQQTLIGEGDAARKRAVMTADGALQQRLDTWLSGVQYMSNAIASYRGNWVPTIVSGGSGDQKQVANGAMQFMDLVSAKFSRDLALDMSMKPPKE